MAEYQFDAEVLQSSLPLLEQPEELYNLVHTREFKIWMNTMLALEQEKRIKNSMEVSEQ